MKIEKFLGDGKRLFSLKYDIIDRVNENVQPDSRTSEQDLASTFCIFFVDKITNIRDRLKKNNRFVIQKERKPGVLEFNQVSESYVQKIIWESKATNFRTDPIPSKLVKKFKMYFTPVITTLITYNLEVAHLAKTGSYQ